MLTQWAAFHQGRTYAELRANHPSRRFVTTLDDSASEKIACQVPAASVLIDSKRIWFIDPTSSLVFARLGVFPAPSAFTFGSGAASVTTLIGEAWRRRIVSEGRGEHGLFVTGHPDQDGWHQLVTADRRSTRRELASRVSASPDRPWLTLISPAIGFRDEGACRAGEVSVDQLLEDLCEVVTQMRRAQPLAEIIVKVHPRDEIERLQKLRDRDMQVRIVRDVRTEVLVRASELVVCQWSTVALMSLALRTPLALFDFRDTQSAEVYQGILDLPVARDLPSFSRNLARLLNAPDFRQQQIGNQTRLANECLRVDGQATQRIVDLIARLSHGQNIPAESSTPCAR